MGQGTATVLSGALWQLRPPSLRAKPTQVCRGQPGQPPAPGYPGGFANLPFPARSSPAHAAQPRDLGSSEFPSNAGVQVLPEPSGLHELPPTDCPPRPQPQPPVALAQIIPAAS